MKHFGYNDQTIVPYETIDHKVDYIRIRSTLRGANLLGAYMIVVVGVLTQRFLLVSRRRVAYGLLLLGAVVTLFASGSRGAWIGAVVALATLLWLQAGSSHLRRVLLYGSVAAMLAFGTAWFCYVITTLCRTRSFTPMNILAPQSAQMMHI